MNPTILIVDDDPRARATLEVMLAGQPYRLEMAENGVQALEKADALLPDLVLLDVMMPGMDGFEACKRMRAAPQLVELHIILLTALDDRASLLRGLEAGADDFLTKPVDRQELLARLHTITRLNRYRTLLQQRESLREMAARVVAAQEDERRRISRELHDDLGQALTAHLLGLRNFRERLSPELHDPLNGLIAETQETIAKIRLLAQDLRPPVLDTLGLEAALKTYCDEFSRRANLPVSVEVDESLPPVSDLQAVIVYRVLQEALTNVIKHAQARRVWVELAVEDDTLALTVQDDGVGTQPAAPSDGVGLVGMRERLALAGGELRFRSRPGKGTVLEARLPRVETVEKGGV